MRSPERFRRRPGSTVAPWTIAPTGAWPCHRRVLSAIVPPNRSAYRPVIANRTCCPRCRVSSAPPRQPPKPRATTIREPGRARCGCRRGSSRCGGSNPGRRIATIARRASRPAMTGRPSPHHSSNRDACRPRNRVPHSARRRVLTHRRRGPNGNARRRRNRHRHRTARSIASHPRNRSTAAAWAANAFATGKTRGPAGGDTLRSPARRRPGPRCFGARP